MARLSVRVLALCVLFVCLPSCLANNPANLCTEVGRSCNTNSDCCSSCCTDGLCLRSCQPADNPCSRVRCPSETRCVLEQVNCFQAPCDPAANCMPTNPCDVVRCRAGFHCEAKEVYCIRAPCPRVANCVPDVEVETNPCASVLCKTGTQCVSQPGSCDQPPCPPMAACLPIENGGGRHRCRKV